MLFERSTLFGTEAWHTVSRSEYGLLYLCPSLAGLVDPGAQDSVYLNTSKEFRLESVNQTKKERKSSMLNVHLRKCQNRLPCRGGAYFR